jgi:hypothetical protein
VEELRRIVRDMRDDALLAYKAAQQGELKLAVTFLGRFRKDSAKINERLVFIRQDKRYAQFISKLELINRTILGSELDDSRPDMLLAALHNVINLTYGMIRDEDLNIENIKRYYFLLHPEDAKEASNFIGGTSLQEYWQACIEFLQEVLSDDTIMLIFTVSGNRMMPQEIRRLHESIPWKRKVFLQYEKILLHEQVYDVYDDRKVEMVFAGGNLAFIGKISTMMKQNLPNADVVYFRRAIFD